MAITRAKIILVSTMNTEQYPIQVKEEGCA